MPLRADAYLPPAHNPPLLLVRADGFGYEQQHARMDRIIRGRADGGAPTRKLVMRSAGHMNHSDIVCLGKVGGLEIFRYAGLGGAIGGARALGIVSHAVRVFFLDALVAAGGAAGAAGAISAAAGVAGPRRYALPRSNLVKKGDEEWALMGDDF